VWAAVAAHTHPILVNRPFAELNKSPSSEAAPLRQAQCIASPKKATVYTQINLSLLRYLSPLNPPFLNAEGYILGEFERLLFSSPELEARGEKVLT
jgi:hypothetical protein